jgi:hypothetical protein
LPYSIVTNGCYHDGPFEITGVTTSTIKVRNRSIKKPPLRRVVGGDFNVLTTVLKATGASDGLKMGQEGGIALFENVALLGTRTGNAAGILTQGRIGAVPLTSGGLSFGDATQRALRSSVQVGGFVAVLDWVFNIFNGAGSLIDARMIAAGGALLFNYYGLEGSELNARRAVFNGSSNNNVLVNSGARMLGTEAKIVGGNGDGIRLGAGASLYAESLFLIGNAIMGLRSATPLIDISQGINLFSGASAFYMERGAGAKISNYIIAGAVSAGIDAQFSGLVHVNDTWITGNRANGINNNGGLVNADGSAVTGSGNIGSYILAQGETWFRGGFLRNAIVSMRSDGGGRHFAPGSRVPTAEVSGALSLIDLSSPLGSAATLTGVPRYNEITKDGAIILNGAASTGFGVPGIRIAGGSNTNFTLSVNSTQDCASVGAGLQLALPADVTVTGAAVGMIVSVTSNLANEFLSYYGRVTAANTVRVYVINNSASAFDPPNATYTIKVEGFTA